MINNNPLVSIITPTYNHERFIGQCIESVLKQSYTNWEMIIINDASRDRTLDIAKEYALKDSRIRILDNKENKGAWRLAEIYNSGLNISRGEIIALLEGDDFWAPDKLALQVPQLADPDTVLSYGNVAETDENGNVIDLRRVDLRINKSVKFNNPVGSALYVFASLADMFYFQSIVIKKSSLEKIGGFQGNTYLPITDYPTYLDLCLCGTFSVVENKVIGYWRRHHSSITHTVDEINNLKEKLSGCFIEFLETNRKLLENLNINLHPGIVKKQHKKLIHVFRERYFIYNAKNLIKYNDWKGAEASYYNAFRNTHILLYKFAGLLAWFFAKLRVDILKPITMFRRFINP